MHESFVPAIISKEKREKNPFRHYTYFEIQLRKSSGSDGKEYAVSNSLTINSRAGSDTAVLSATAIGHYLYEVSFPEHIVTAAEHEYMVENYEAYGYNSPADVPATGQLSKAYTTSWINHVNYGQTYSSIEVNKFNAKVRDYYDAGGSPDKLGKIDMSKYNSAVIGDAYSYPADTEHIYNYAKQQEYSDLDGNTEEIKMIFMSTNSVAVNSEANTDAEIEIEFEKTITSGSSTGYDIGGTVGATGEVEYLFGKADANGDPVHQGKVTFYLYKRSADGTIAVNEQATVEVNNGTASYTFSDKAAASESNYGFFAIYIDDAYTYASSCDLVSYNNVVHLTADKGASIGFIADEGEPETELPIELFAQGAEVRFKVGLTSEQYGIDSVEAVTTSGDTIELSGQDGVYTFIMPDESVRVNAKTALLPKVKLVGGDHGKVDFADEKHVGASEAYFASDSAVMFTVTPNSGYDGNVVVTTEDGNVSFSYVSGDSTYSFTMPDKDVTVAVAFENSGYNLLREFKAVAYPPEPDYTDPTSSTGPSKVTVDDGIVQTGDFQNIKIVLWSLLLLCILLLVVFVHKSRNEREH